MKVVGRLLVAAIVVAVIVLPLTLLADQLPAPLEKKLPSGVTTVSYAGQNLRFTSPTPLVVRLEPVNATRIKLTVRAYGSTSDGGPAGSASALDLNIYWENWSNTVYNGPPPVSQDWEGVLNTESGFTEK